MHHLSKLTPSHSCDHDNLSAITLKSIANEICECVTLIINQSYGCQLSLYYFQKMTSQILKIIGQFPFYQLYLNYLKMSCKHN